MVDNCGEWVESSEKLKLGMTITGLYISSYYLSLLLLYMFFFGSSILILFTFKIFVVICYFLAIFK